MPRDDRRLRSLSLCSGIGGLDLALAEHCRTVGYCEREAFAQAVLLARMEDASLDRAPIFSDLERFPSRAFRGAVDIVVSGFPCPPFSQAGKQLGADDERYLWPLIRRVLVGTRAPLAFLENVWGAVRHPDGLGRWLSDLDRLGFDAEWQVVRASDVGAPHERSRVFVLAYRNEQGRGLIRSLGLFDGERATLRNDANGCDQDVANTRPRWRILAQQFWDEAQPNAGATGEYVGDADAIRWREGSGRRLDAAGRTRSFETSRPSWPPLQDDADGWRQYIESGGPQPAIRRGADGPPNRVDRLRALGNAVVPAQARAAFRLLAGRLR